ncbi:MAG: hypothetical protein AAF376_12120 [Pseudomonadota bacterium]
MSHKTARAMAFGFMAALGALALPFGAQAQDEASGLELIQRSGHAGTMQMPEEMASLEVDGSEGIVFEPYQMTDELYERHDLVFLMRAGPSDWTEDDAPAATVSDCTAQRSISARGYGQMRALGAMMGIIGVIPGEIVASEWCRTQDTVAALVEGFAFIDEDQAEAIPVATEPYVNQLDLSGDDADVAMLEQTIRDWDGNADGPLLIVTHFENIQALTQFNVYAGEMLVLDPVLDGRVLGYLRLISARPDRVHFDPSVVFE